MEWKGPDVWETLACERRPILLYGMGDGADKLLRVFAEKGIRAAGVFASDDFVRGHSFAGFPVLRLSEAVERFGEDLVIVLGFGSQRPELLERFAALDARFAFYAPDVPVCGGGLFDRAYARARRAELEQAYALLADAQSRRVFENVVAFRLTGKIQYLRACETTREEAFTLLAPGAREHFADLGAYNGDTIRELLYYTGGAFASVTAFEPDRRNFKKLRKYAEEALQGGSVTLVAAGAWARDEELVFAAKAGRNSRIAKEGVPTQMRALDSVLQGAPCTLLKLDVEGAEREALEGARETIAVWRPNISCAVYHRVEDLFALPLYVHENWPDYRLYLRRQPYVPAWDMNLYAVRQG